MRTKTETVKILINILLILIWGLISSKNAFADVAVDISAVDGLSDQQGSIGYTLTFDNLDEIKSLSVSAGEFQKTYLKSDTDIKPLSPVSGRKIIYFEGFGVGKFNPSIQIDFIDKTLSPQIHSEEFYYEKNSPEIYFNGIRFYQDNDGNQYLICSVNAQDDVDIRSVGFSISGIFSSTLRNCGGVVEKAKERAFLKTDGYVFITPEIDGQGQFQISLPIKNKLSADTIAHDGIILIDAVAADSSGNQKTISKLSFTGEDVDDKALNLSVSQSQIIFSNQLESSVIIPIVEFQFRGNVVLNGPGRGVSYVSSNPNLVSVSESGVVLPVNETHGEAVYITVVYPGTEPKDVLVDVDYSKELVALKANEINMNNPLVLQRLNSYFTLPSIIGVFNDGSESFVDAQLPIKYEISPNDRDNIDINDRNEIMSRNAISVESPILIQVGIANKPDIVFDLPVSANDALPDVELSVDGTIEVDSDVTLLAKTHDDVGISEVRFYMNESSLVGVRKSAPYSINIQVNEEYIDRELSFYAIAMDSSGQQTVSLYKKVRVVSKIIADVPDVTVEKPAPMQRSIEGSEVRFQVYRGSSQGCPPSGISYVEFFLDDQRIGEAYSPVCEVRSQQGNSYFVEVWRIDRVLPSISVNETSRSFYARVHGFNDGVEQTESRVFKIIKNMPPLIRFESPVEGTSVCEKQIIDLTAEVTDDALAGMAIDLSVNGQVVDTFICKPNNSGSIDIKKESHIFNYRIGNETIGTTLKFQLTATDFQGLTATSEILTIPVRDDLPPNVSIVSPIEGAQFISGLPVEIRADAVDDVSIQRVDFFIDDSLVGSDSTFPFHCIHNTDKDFIGEKELVLKAKAIDSKNQETFSPAVHVTLGKDNQPPVVNIVSPVITSVVAGDEIASVIENSVIVLKASGFDNLQVSELELRGVQKIGGQYYLTGNLEHLLSGDEFKPQQIPGALSAFSAVKLVQAPVFSNSPNVVFDRYPVEVKATDAAGNSSISEIVIGVIKDSPPVVTAVYPERDYYYSKDKVIFGVQATDDRGVNALSVSLYSDGSVNPILTKNMTQPSDFNPGTNIRAYVDIDLNPLLLSNSSHTLNAEIIATDITGRLSESYGFTIPVRGETHGPSITITKPVQGSVLFNGSHTEISIKVIDESILNRIQVFCGVDQIYHIDNVGTIDHTLSLSYDVPGTGNELPIRIVASDMYGNESESTWTYSLISDQPPTVFLKNPPSGSRLVEGEAFTLSAVVNDNNRVSSVEFFIRKDGNPIPLFSKSLTGTGLEQAMENDNLVSCAMYAPHKPEAGEPQVSIGVRVTDDSNNVSEALLEFEILDDLEKPEIVVETPKDSISVVPGSYFTVKCTASDNMYVGKINVLLIDENNNEYDLEERQHILETVRIETLTAPNPDSFGSLITGRRFFKDYKASVLLPQSFETLQSEGYSLVIRAEDNGINIAESTHIDFHVLKDKDGPEIEIINPGETVYEGQYLFYSVYIRDLRGVSSYRVYLKGQEDTPLFEESGLTSTGFGHVGEIPGMSAFDSIENNSFILVVEAEDIFGNASVKERSVTVVEDNPPLLSIPSPQSGNSVIKGSLASQIVRIEDDYTAVALPLKYFQLFTTLNGMMDGEFRDPVGFIGYNEYLEDPSDNVFSDNFGYDYWYFGIPFIDINYPEADNLSGQIYLLDQKYIETLAGQTGTVMRVWPAKDSLNSVNSRLKINFGDEYTIIYHIDRYIGDLCDGASDSLDETDTEGDGINLYDFMAGSGKTVHTLIITPEVKDGNGNSIQTWLKKIRIDSKSIDTKNRIVSTVFIRQKVINDDDDEIAAIGSTSLVTYPKPFTNYSLNSLYGAVKPFDESESNSFVPTIEDAKQYTILAHGTDYQSIHRDKVPLKIRSERDMVTDEEPPSIVVVSPGNGIEVPPGKTIDITLDVKDNSQWVSVLKLIENNTRTCLEIAGVEKKEKYTLPYHLAEDYSQNDLELLIIAEDLSGNTQTQTLTFPVVLNNPPELTFSKFSFNKNQYGSYLNIFNDPTRVDYGEFWVKTGSDFKLDSEIWDDSGLELFTIYRIDSSGNRIEVFKEEFQASCPELNKIQERTESEITYDQNISTQYDVVVIDNLSNKTTRSFIVHPLENMAPQVRIVSPAQDQKIVAGARNLQVGVVVTDDSKLISNDIDVYANGVKLSLLSDDSELERFGETSIVGGDGVVVQAFSSIYDEIEALYSVEYAEKYGKKESEYARQARYVFSVPQGVLKAGLPLSISAVVTDHENAMGR
ncbi:MAG: hypothetical protein KKD44_17450, partial [Proteobacteria bacterium]|nr:hypothetical protein [Pseudomonadota bacterium]